MFVQWRKFSVLFFTLFRKNNFNHLSKVADSAATVFIFIDVQKIIFIFLSISLSARAIWLIAICWIDVVWYFFGMKLKWINFNGIILFLLFICKYFCHIFWIDRKLWHVNHLVGVFDRFYAKIKLRGKMRVKIGAEKKQQTLAQFQIENLFNSVWCVFGLCCQTNLCWTIELCFWMLPECQNYWVFHLTYNKWLLFKFCARLFMPIAY